jgi:transposase-like protein
MEFLVDSLKKNPKAAYADLKAKGDEKKLKLFPIMFGRAQALLGIVKSAKRGTGKAAQASAAKRGRKPDGNSKSAQVRALLATGMSAADIAKKVGCSTPLVYTIKSSMKRGGGAKRGPGRPPKAASPRLDGLAGILDAVKQSERERTQLRSALERIQAVIADALA